MANNIKKMERQASGRPIAKIVRGASAFITELPKDIMESPKAIFGGQKYDEHGNRKYRNPLKGPLQLGVALMVASAATIIAGPATVLAGATALASTALASTTFLTASAAVVGATATVMGINKVKNIVSRRQALRHFEQNAVQTRAKSNENNGSKPKVEGLLKRMQRVASYKAFSAMRATTLAVVPFTATYRAIRDTAYVLTHFHNKQNDVAYTRRRIKSETGVSATKQEAKESLKESKKHHSAKIRDSLLSASQFDRPDKLGSEQFMLATKLMTPEEFYVRILSNIANSKGTLSKTLSASEEVFFDRLENPVKGMQARLKDYRRVDLEGDSYASVHDNPKHGVSPSVTIAKTDLSAEEVSRHEAMVAHCNVAPQNETGADSIDMYPVWYLMQTASKDGVINESTMNSALRRGMKSGDFVVCDATRKVLASSYNYLNVANRVAYAKSTQAQPQAAKQETTVVKKERKRLSPEIDAIDFPVEKPSALQDNRQEARTLSKELGRYYDMEQKHTADGNEEGATAANEVQMQIRKRLAVLRAATEKPVERDVTLEEAVQRRQAVQTVSDNIIAKESFRAEYGFKASALDYDLGGEALDENAVLLSQGTHAVNAQTKQIQQETARVNAQIVAMEQAVKAQQDARNALNLANQKLAALQSSFEAVNDSSPEVAANGADGAPKTMNGARPNGLHV